MVVDLIPVRVKNIHERDVRRNVRQPKISMVIAKFKAAGLQACAKLTAALPDAIGH